MSKQANTKQRTPFIVLSIIGLLFIVFFGLRAFRAFKKFDGHPPRPPFADEIETDVEKIEDWMTVPFISHSYGLPPEMIFNALKISDKSNFKKSLSQLNEEFYPDTDGFVLETVKAAILAHQATLTVDPPQPPSAPLTPPPPATP